MTNRTISDDFVGAIVRADLPEIQHLLEQDNQLASLKLNITDLSGRKFDDITLLQFSVWCLDFEMVQIALLHLSESEVKEQLNIVNKKKLIFKQHGIHYNHQELIDKMQEYIDNYNIWDEEFRQTFWINRVGAAQRLVPAWLIYIWCETGDSAFWNNPISDEDLYVRLCSSVPTYEDPLHHWFNDKQNGESGVGSTWAFYHGPTPLYFLNSPWRPLFPSREDVEHDLRCIRILFQSRLKRVTEFLSTNKLHAVDRSAGSVSLGFFAKLNMEEQPPLSTQNNSTIAALPSTESRVKIKSEEKSSSSSSFCGGCSVS